MGDEPAIPADQGSDDLKARAVLVLAGAGVSLVAGHRRFVRCERACAEAQGDAEDLFAQGRYLEALAVIGSNDSKCRCARFTSGDAPPQYALADACLRALLDDGRRAEIDELVEQTGGPILTELAAAGTGRFT